MDNDQFSTWKIVVAGSRYFAVDDLSVNKVGSRNCSDNGQYVDCCSIEVVE